MNYIVNETQTTNGVTTVVAPVVKNTLPDAQEKFFEVCKYACKSSVDIHAVYVMTEEGYQMQDLTKVFVHNAQENTEQQ